MAARRSLGNVLGISFKVVSMTLAELFLGAGDRSPRWMVVGGSMVAIDTLVHSFLHRTGIIEKLGAAHLYGSYGPLNVMGGIGTLVGPIAGAWFFLLLREVFSRIFGDQFPYLIPVGIIFIAMIIFMPQGAAGLRAALAQSVAVDANDR